MRAPRCIQLHLRVDPVLCDGHDLTGHHIADKLGVHRRQGSTLGCEHIPADAKRLQTQRVPDADQLLRAHEQQRISALELLRHPADRFLDGRGRHSLLCHTISDDLRVCGARKNHALLQKLLSHLFRVCDISVVGERKRPLGIIQKYGLRIFHTAGSGCRIADMTDSDVAVKALQHLLRKHLAHQAHALVGSNVADRSVHITDYDTGRLLPSVLQGYQPIINHLRRIIVILLPDTKYAALLMKLVLHHKISSVGCTLKTELLDASQSRRFATSASVRVRSGQNKCLLRSRLFCFLFFTHTRPLLRKVVASRLPRLFVYARGKTNACFAVACFASSLQKRALWERFPKRLCFRHGHFIPVCVLLSISNLCLRAVFSARCACQPSCRSVLRSPP